MKPSPLAEEPIGLLVAAVRRGVRQLLMSWVEPLGLSMQQFWVLVGIAEHPCHSQAELAARLRVDDATACRAIRKLAARRFVRTARDGQDRRRVKLELTPEGERLARKLLPVAQRVRSGVESALSAEERAATRACLTKILVALDELSRAEPAQISGPRRKQARGGRGADSGQTDALARWKATR